MSTNNTEIQEDTERTYEVISAKTLVIYNTGTITATLKLLGKFHKIGLYGRYHVYINGELHRTYESSRDNYAMEVIGTWS